MTETVISSGTVLDAISTYCDSDNPSAYLALNSKNEYFTLEGTPGVIVYRTTGRYLVQFGGPFAPPQARPRLLSAFVEHSAAQDRRIVGVQLQAADAAPYLELGFTVNQMGASYAVDLDSFSLQGTAFMRLRNKISRAMRTGLTVGEVPLEPWQERMRQLDAGWLGTKGEGVKPLEFLVGQYGGPYQYLRRVFAAWCGEELVGYILYSPVWGSRAGWMHDLSRRQPNSPPGVMEAVNKHAIDVMREEGVRWLHFGFTPFTALDEGIQFPGYSRAFHWFMSEMWEHGEGVYPAQTQFAYKQKWAPDVVLPEYLAFQDSASLPALVHVFRACNAV